MTSTRSRSSILMACLALLLVGAGPGPSASAQGLPDLSGRWVGYNPEGKDAGTNTITQTGKDLTIHHPNGQVTSGGYLVDAGSLVIPVWGTTGKLSQSATRIDLEGGSMGGWHFVKEGAGSPGVPAGPPAGQPGGAAPPGMAGNPAGGAGTTPGTAASGSGDADGDGVVTARDAVMAIRMAVRLIPTNLACDMDGNGAVDSNDVRQILLKVVGK